MRAPLTRVLVGLLLTTACGGGSFPPDRYYRLEASPPRAPLETPRFAGSLRVAPLRADGLTRGTALLQSDAARPSEVARDPYRHWVDSPTAMLQRAITDFLRQARVADVVLPADTSAPADWLVSGRILRLERVVSADGSAALVEVELDVARGSPREPVFHARYREQRPGSRDGVAGLNEALDAVLRRFLADLADAT